MAAIASFFVIVLLYCLFIICTYKYRDYKCRVGKHCRLRDFEDKTLCSNCGEGIK